MMRILMRSTVMLLVSITAGAATPAVAIVNYQGDIRPLPKVVVDLNVDRLNEALGVQTVVEKFWAEVGQRYDGMAQFRGVGGEFRAGAVYARFCLPRCGPAMLQKSAVILRRPRETFRGAFSRAYASGQLSNRLSNGSPDPGASRRIGEYRNGPSSYCFYGDCGLSELLRAASTLTCATAMDGSRFCARL